MEKTKPLFIGPLSYAAIPIDWTKKLVERLKVDVSTAVLSIVAVREARGKGREIAYARTKSAYSKIPARYRHQTFSYDRVLRSIDILSKRGLIDDSPSRAGFYGHRSTFESNPSLIESLADIVPTTRLHLSRASEVIICRSEDEHGNRILLDYKENAATRRMRSDLMAHNEFVASTAILDGSGNDAGAPSVRFFKDDLKTCGRIYARGSTSWQNLRNRMGERLAITIAGEPVVEIDFASMSPNMLRLREGLPVLDDCYSLDQWSRTDIDPETGKETDLARSLAKVGVQCLLNANSRQGAWMALASSEAMGEFAPHAPADERGQIARAMVKGLMERHREIEKHFFKGVYGRLQKDDSDIANDVLKICRKNSVLALPIHDSFLVQERHKDILMASMDEAAHKHGYRGLQFKVSLRNV